MFGYVTADWQELDAQQRSRYGAVYCGICRRIQSRSSQIARLGLQYDMAFLAMLLMSLYEPEEQSGSNTCLVHPVKSRPWTVNDCVDYAADMNVALAYYKALDDWQDDGSRKAQLFAKSLEPSVDAIRQRFPRQCEAISGCIQSLGQLEQAGERNPDKPAACFGQLMGELMVYRQDFWADSLNRLGFHLGRFIYLVDAMLDFDRDRKKGSYNPLVEVPREDWEQYLLLAMAKCTEAFEKLPLVQDKAILDNILYSGVWIQYRQKQRKEDHRNAGSL